MSILKSCCCFTNVRSGSLACGVYSLVLALMSSGIVAYNIYIYQLTNSYPDPADVDLGQHGQLSKNFSATLDYMTFNYNDSLPLDFPEMDLRSHRIFQGIFLCALVVACLLFFGSLLLLVGVSLDKKGLLVPWLAVMAANVALDTGTMVYHTTIIKSLTYIIIEMVIWLLLTVLNIYCLLCVTSQYQELKSGRGTRDDVRPLSMRVVYRAGPQHVHINQGPVIINGLLASSLTSSLHGSGMARPGSTHVTATLLMSAPDYNIVAGEPPQYQELTGNGHIVIDKDSLLAHLPQQRSKGNHSPPPPYSSS